ELAAHAPAWKRGRHRQEPPPVQGKHDAEAGGSRSRARSRLGQAHVQVPDAGDVDVASKYLNDDAEWSEEHEPRHEAPVEPPPAAPLQPPHVESL
ncbi:hypothetical protein A2U01_0060223, partial [Trifolium medium]|nr:hypothetical protein [Trifolium medium]